VTALVLHVLTRGRGSTGVKAWRDESYARFLYPDLDLDPRRIIGYLKEIGKERRWRLFSGLYSDFVRQRSAPGGTPLDRAPAGRAGAPDAAGTGFSGRSGNGGDAGSGSRLTAFIDKNSGYPVYLKNVPENLPDWQDLLHVFHETDGNRAPPFYHDRRDIGIILDFAQYGMDLPPSKTPSESVLRGRVTVAFMAAAAHACMRGILENSDQPGLSVSDALEILDRHVTVVHADKNFHVPAAPSPTARMIYEALGVAIPDMLRIS
jgi:hypothetical protein